jgi:uncharacterized protein
MLKEFTSALFIFIAICGNPSHSASFDCRPSERSGTCPEAVICSNATIGRLDEQLASSYEDLLKKLSRINAETLRQEQREWLKNRNGCHCVTTCIEDQYHQRIEELAQLGSSNVDRLTIGYDDEGKVDATTEGCTKYVKDMTLWDQAAIEKGSQEVCSARQHHVQAYEQLQKSFQNLMIHMSADRRLNRKDATEYLRSFIKSCLDYKFQVTTGGHNIGIDIIANEIAALCLRQMAKMLDYDASHLYRPW